MSTSDSQDALSELKNNLERMHKLLTHARSYKGFVLPASVAPLFNAVELQTQREEFDLARQKASSVCQIVSTAIRGFVGSQINGFEQRIEHVYGRYDAEVQATFGQVHQLIAELKHLTRTDIYDHAVVSNKMRVLEDMLNRAAAEEEKRRKDKRVREICSLLEQNRKLIAA